MPHPKFSSEMTAHLAPQPDNQEKIPTPTTLHAQSEGRRKLVLGGFSSSSENLKDMGKYPEWVQMRVRLATLEEQHLKWVDDILADNAANDPVYSQAA